MLKIQSFKPYIFGIHFQNGLHFKTTILLCLYSIVKKLVYSLNCFYSVLSVWLHIRMHYTQIWLNGEVNRNTSTYRQYTLWKPMACLLHDLFIVIQYILHISKIIEVCTTSAGKCSYLYMHISLLSLSLSPLVVYVFMCVVCILLDRNHDKLSAHTVYWFVFVLIRISLVALMLWQCCTFICQATAISSTKHLEALMKWLEWNNGFSSEMWWRNDAIIVTVSMAKKKTEES